MRALYFTTTFPHASGTGNAESGQCLQGSSQAALVTSSLILVNDFLVSDTIDRRHRRLEHCGSRSLVAGFNGLADSLDRRAQHRTLAGIVSVLLDCLTSTLARLCGICHVYFLRRDSPAYADYETEFFKAVNYNGFLKNGQTLRNLPQLPREHARRHGVPAIVPLAHHHLQQPSGYNCAP